MLNADILHFLNIMSQTWTTFSRILHITSFQKIPAELNSARIMYLYKIQGKNIRNHLRHNDSHACIHHSGQNICDIKINMFCTNRRSITDSISFKEVVPFLTGTIWRTCTCHLLLIGNYTIHRQILYVYAMTLSSL